MESSRKTTSGSVTPIAVTIHTSLSHVMKPLTMISLTVGSFMSGFDSVYVERAGQLVETNVRFKDQAHLNRIVDEAQQIVTRSLGGK